jgi:hypothetical protein
LIDDLPARHRQFTAKPADRQSIEVPNDDPGWNGHAQAFPARAPQTRRDPAVTLPR